jgi:hypothetical protein
MANLLVAISLSLSFRNHAVVVSRGIKSTKTIPHAAVKPPKMRKMARQLSIDIFAPPTAYIRRAPTI